MSELVVSYQMGKVGSSSITASIADCVQMHSWSGINPYMYFSSIYTGSFKGRVYDYIRWNFRYTKLLMRVKATKGPIKLIVGVREPVSRNVSGYFQSLTSLKDRAVDLEWCLQNFYVNCPHYLPLFWFDVELKERLGVDVYQHPFDQFKGYVRFSQGPYDVFVYQQEKLANLNVDIADFLNDESFELVRLNKSSQKWYSDLNKSFVEQFKPAPSYLDSMYCSKYMRHFYSDEDMIRFRDNWS